MHGASPTCVQVSRAACFQAWWMYRQRPASKPGRGPLLEDWLRKRDEDWVHEVSGFHAKNTRRIDRDL